MSLMITHAQLRDTDTTSLYEANRMIVAEIRARHAQEAQKRMSALKHNDVAAFFSKQGRRVYIRVTNFNQKTVGGYEVKVDGEGWVSDEAYHAKWRVAPSLLTKIETKGTRIRVNAA